MENKSVTAVEWLEKNYHELLVEASINNMHVVLFDKKRGELFQQAKAMEKEQIESSYIEGANVAKKVFIEELKEFIVLPKDYIN